MEDRDEMLLRPMNNKKKKEKRSRIIQACEAVEFVMREKLFPYWGNRKRRTGRTNGQNDTRMTETEQEKRLVLSRNSTLEKINDTDASLLVC